MLYAEAQHAGGEQELVVDQRRHAPLDGLEPPPGLALLVYEVLVSQNLQGCLYCGFPGVGILGLVSGRHKVTLVENDLGFVVE